MNRRKFLKSLMVGTAGIAAAPLMVRTSFTADESKKITMLLGKKVKWIGNEFISESELIGSKSWLDKMVDKPYFNKPLPDI